MEEELVDAFLTPDQANFSVASPKTRHWSGRPAIAPGATSFHVAVTKCSLGAEWREFASTLSLLDSDWMNRCWGRAHRPHSHGGAGPRAAGARQTGTQTGCCSCELDPVRATTIVLEASTAYHCNTARLDDTHHGSGSVWPGRAWLEGNTTTGAAKVHQLIREPIGFQAARGNADEQLKPRDARTAGGRTLWNQRVARRRRAAFPPTISGRDAQGAHILSRDHWGCDAVPPRSLTELPDQGIDTLIDLIMLIEEKSEWPTLRNRIVFIAKAAGGVRPIGLLFATVRVQRKLRRVEAKMCEARNTEGLFWATQARGVERCV